MIVLILLAVVFVVGAALYAMGAINLLASPAAHHYKHAALLGVLAVASLVAASLVRPRPTAT
jgi:hypothetical protein